MLGSAEACHALALLCFSGEKRKKYYDLTDVKTTIYQYSLEISAVDAATKKTCNSLLSSCARNAKHYGEIKQEKQQNKKPL